MGWSRSVTDSPRSGPLITTNWPPAVCRVKEGGSSVMRLVTWLLSFGTTALSDFSTSDGPLRKLDGPLDRLARLDVDADPTLGSGGGHHGELDVAGREADGSGAGHVADGLAVHPDLARRGSPDEDPAPVPFLFRFAPQARAALGVGELAEVDQGVPVQVALLGHLDDHRGGRRQALHRARGG